MRNATYRIAEALANHPEVLQVFYSGLLSHPDHEIAASQMSGGFGGMLSIRLAGGEGKVRDVTARLKILKRTTSLGAVESLIEHHASVERPGALCPY